MNCKQGTSHIISQITGLLELMDNERYQKPLFLFKGSSVGQHFRHISDFYDCFFRGLNEGIIDYSNRKRNPEIENDSDFARKTFLGFLDEIECCREEEIIEVRGEFSEEFGVDRPLVKSSVGRELMYAYDHAVHHLAMIKMGMRAAFPELEIDEKIGVAPSTLKHWKNENVQSSKFNETRL